MKTQSLLGASIQSTLFRVMGVLMIAALLAGAAYSVQPVGQVLAAACTATDGLWSVPATWSCGHAPTSADDVTIDAATAAGVVIDDNVSVHNLTINSLGVVSFNAAVTLTITGDFSVAATGLFDPGSDGGGNASTVVFDTGSQTITTHGEWVEFWNLSKVAAGAGETLSVDPAVSDVGGIRINNDLTLRGASASNFLLLRSTVSGSQWQIDPDGARDIDLVDVKDSNNVNTAVIDVVQGTDSGNNTGWNFSASGVSLTSFPNPSLIGQNVTFTATITPNTATGTVAFTDSNDAIAGCESVTVTQAAGVASAVCITGALDLGTHTITAIYSGDSVITGSTSAPLDQKVISPSIFLPFINR